jgi:IS5 family transposase
VKYEYIIILLLVVICGMWSFQTCNHRAEVATSQAKYDSLDAKVVAIAQKIILRDAVIDSIENRVDSLSKKKKGNTAAKDAKIDTVRHASTIQLDSILRSIIARHHLPE